ncbi:TPA: restriction endonuclease subunit S [Vibrio parahaemolyticus]|nr:restriction endonuclease subunit S [Vibrio parahaemolyticus]HCH5272783.1 restriction endonuclease subunit S [Vibrio parahaemolyticus]
MSCNWPLVKLADVACIITTKIDANQITKDCYISTENMQPYKGGVSSADSLPSAAKFNSFRVGDTLFSNIRTYFEKVWLASFSGGASADVLIFRTKDESVLLSEYLYHFLSSPEFIEFTVRTSKGAKMPRGDKGAMMDFEFKLPPVEIQKIIACSLQGLERKVRLNSQTNQTLEQMAQAIFKSWFVDFDPVKAKINGEQPEGMDAATASLFPEKLDSETGIPDGWTQGSIADIAKLNAKSWTKKNSPEQVHYVDLANTKNGVIESVTTYDFEESPSRARRILNSGDTIVGTVRPGNRSYAFIGDTEKPLTGSTGFAVLSPKKSYWTSFVYLATTNDDSIDEYARLADGGAYPAIKPAVVADTQCAIPTEDIAKKFWELTGPMLRKAHQNRLQNEDLAALRDTLLPKLLSGDVKLSDPIVKVGEIG